MEYSGRTTAYQHKRDDWAEHKGPFEPAISQVTIFNAQWTDCPIELEDEIHKLWVDNELHNDVSYYSWNSTEDSGDAEAYPLIHEYLTSKGVTECLIHWWW